MAKSPAQIAIALLLAAVYAIVGSTGESLHYMFSGAAAPTASTAGEPQQRQGYFHCHGPDFHWHHHSWLVKQEEADPSAAQSTRVLAKLRPPHHPHEPHACPVLAAVATLKLASGRTELLPADIPARQFLAHSGAQQPARHFLSPHLPRGPPAAPA
ncbi:hypothetical protein NG895_19460 [Aeoliella sp. ICT_H6.2]|uniref:Uncharacterized protein n=1 Tax=Aeoliella straminimaris TaxID=2954799 RepID=A0A9X2FGM2_9BACT|nr:hypothetical protein [Aeoliella straminimaris]MCO6046084.1 hypothetical protein [Aeoliella straminimaris]